MNMQDDEKINQDSENIPSQSEPGSAVESTSISLPKVESEDHTNNEKPPQPSKLKRFERTVLIWMAVIAVAFLAGLLTYHYTRYQPLKNTLEKTTTELTQARTDTEKYQSQLKTLQSELSTSTGNIKSLESDNTSLKAQLEKAEIRAGLLQVLANVKDARMGLAADDVSAAKSALQAAPKNVEDLLPAIEKLDSNLAKSVPQRLELVLFELDTDPQTAATDLQLLGSSLQFLIGLIE